MTYFSVDVPMPFSTVFVSVSPFFGRVDLYASVSAGAYPTTAAFQYSAVGSAGPDGITIFSVDPAVRTGCARTARAGICTFIVGANTLTSSSKYMLSASLYGEL
jgi:hypothetical protein